VVEAVAMAIGQLAQCGLVMGRWCIHREVVYNKSGIQVVRGDRFPILRGCEEMVLR
jgi:hypothetical protein